MSNGYYYYYVTFDLIFDKEEFNWNYYYIFLRFVKFYILKKLLRNLFFLIFGNVFDLWIVILW